MANKKKKHPGYFSTTGTKPSDWGIKDVNAPFKSSPGGVFDVNKMKQVNNVNNEDEDQKRRARTG